jgi:hemerythrin-like metal-binding protein
MAFYEWKDEYACGIKGIDDQHKIIIKLMNKLYEAIRNGEDARIMKEVFIELLEYANYHFGLELKLFKKYRFIDEAKHIEEHNHFIEKIKTLMIHDYLNSSVASLETLDYLKKWFSNHMLKTDMEYCKYFIYKEMTNDIENDIKTENTLGKRFY